MIKTRLYVLPALVVVLGCSSDPEAPDLVGGGAAATVEMTSQLTFAPSSVTIQVGETVRWRNVSSVGHTVTADASEAQDPSNVELPDGAEPFNSGFVGADGTFSRAFTVPGTYRYFCIPHEGAAMLGTIVVQGAAALSSP